jgi:hypothetical protein
MKPTCSAAVLVLGLVVSVGHPVGATPANQPTRPPRTRLALQEPAPAPYVPPGADLTPAATPAEARRPITKRWWFWAAVGGLAVATVAVIVIAGGSPSAPRSTLGDMEAFGGR